MLGSMNGPDPVELQVFVESGCQQCERALELAREIDGAFTGLAVRIVEISEAGPQRDDVFAVPTFVLDGQVLSLGNPQRAELRQEVQSLLRDRGLLD